MQHMEARSTTGRLTRLTAPGGSTLDFAYDDSLLTSTTWSGPTTGTVSQTYNNKFLVVSRSVNAANTVAIGYDRDNLMTTAGSLTINRNAQSGLVDGTTLGQVTTTQTYDSFKVPSLFTAKHNTTILFSEQLTRDVLFRITKSVQSVLGVATTYDYTYDLRGRLKMVSTNGVVTATYNYDANGNRTQVIEGATTTNGSYDAQDRLTAYGASTYTYTADGELATKTIGTQTTSYTYGAMGQLRAVALPNGTNITYVIDGRNRRVGKQVNGSLTKVWLYKDLLNPVAELDGSGNLVSRFVYGEQSHVPAYMIRSGVTYRFVTDTRGSVRLVVDVATGTVAQRLDYDAWGKISQDTNPGFQPFAFAGGHYDKDTGLTRFGARDYDAQVGRWTDKDTARFEGGENFYLYAFADPVNFMDHYGCAAVGACYTTERDCYTEKVMRMNVGQYTRIWTIRHPNEVDILEQTGSLRADGRRIQKEERLPYEWMREQMHTRIGPPERGKSKYPLWGWYQFDGIHKKRPDLRTSAFGSRGELLVMLELELPASAVLLSDFQKWFCVLNRHFLSLTLDEEEQFFEKHPEQRAARSYEAHTLASFDAVKESWVRIFDLSDVAHEDWEPPEERQIQATFWQIESHQVKSKRTFIAR